METRYPEVTVQLTGRDGNPFVVLGIVTNALKTHLRATGLDPAERQQVVDEFQAEAMGGDYDHLLQTCMTWVEVV